MELKRRAGSEVPPGASRHGRNAMRLAFPVLALLLLSVREARAYTDPGTGALIWQMLAAAFVGLLFYVRKLTSWFRKKKDAKD